MDSSRTTEYRYRANQLTDDPPLWASDHSHLSSVARTSVVDSTTPPANPIYNESERHLLNEISMPLVDDNFDISEFSQSKCSLGVDEIIKNLLINYQMTTKTSDSSMEKLLKLVNNCVRLKGFEIDLFPQTYYELTKSISASPSGMRFICKNKKCNKLTKVIYREKSKSYDLIECSDCGQKIDPVEETNGPRGYFVKLNPVQRIKSILENNFIRNRIKFCKEEEFIGMEHYGKFNTGRIYRNVMKSGDLSMTFFSDGVKVFGSSSNDFWPALLSLNELHSSIRKDFVIPAAIYFGRKKPSGEHMIECVRDDLTMLATNGIDWSLQMCSMNTKVKTLFGVFDSQAKPAFLNMQYPAGLKSCPKCYFTAQKKKHNLIFKHSDQLQLRQTGHYQSLLMEMEGSYLAEHCGIYGQPPMSAIPYYDSIKSTTIDFMHSVDLGITNRIVSLWFQSCNHKLDFYIVGKTRDELNETIKSLTPPDHLPRTIRPLSDLVNYKASEWNSFLLYIFPIVMKRYLVSKYYNHMFLLSFSMTTLLKPKISTSELDLTKRVLNKFVFDLKDLYGEKQLTHNSHLLLHLTEVIKDIGSLSDVNGYIFESMNGQLRDYINGSNNVAKQIAKRSELQFSSQLTLLKIDEPDAASKMEPLLKYKATLNSEFADQITNHFHCIIKYQFATLKYQNVTYTSQSYKREKKSCNWVVKLKNNHFFAIFCFVQVGGDIFGIGEEKIPTENMKIEFEDNIGKQDLLLSHIHIVQTLMPLAIVNITEFEKKCLFIECNSKQYCIMINNGYAF